MRLADHLLRRGPARRGGRVAQIEDLIGHVPHASEEAVGADDAVVGPRRFFFGRGDKERVDPLRVRAVALDQLVRRHDVEPRLRHLPDFGRQRNHRVVLERRAVAPLHFVEWHPGIVLRRIAVALLRDHPLVEEAGERLLDRQQPHVVHRAANEPRVEQMEDGVLDAADVLIDRQPAVHERRVEDLRVVVRGDEPRVVPRRIHERVHRVRLAPGWIAAARTGRVHELLVLRQRIALASREGHIERQLDRQLILRHRHDAIPIAVDHRDRRAPVALPRDQPVAESVADHLLPDAAALDFIADAIDRGRRRQAGDEPGVDDPRRVIFEREGLRQRIDGRHLSAGRRHYDP